MSSTLCPECHGNPQGVLLLNRYVPCKTCRFKKLARVAEEHLHGGSVPRLPGKLVGGKSVASKHIRTKSLGGSTSQHEYEYVAERELEDGERVFVHYGRQSTVSYADRKSAAELEEKILFCSAFETEEEAMAAMGPGAKRT